MSNIVKFNSPKRRSNNMRNKKVISPPQNNVSISNLSQLCKVDNNLFGYLNIGSNEDRNIMGSVTKTVVLKNSNNEVIRISEVHNFANGRKGTTIHMKGLKTKNANRRKN